VSKHPSKTAIETNGSNINYNELNVVANRICGLLKDRGYGTDKNINVLIPSSIEYVASILGVLKAGSIFLPVDPEFPLKRLSQIFSETFHGGLIVNSAGLDRLTVLARALMINIPDLMVIDTDLSLKLYHFTDGQIHPIFFEERDDWKRNPSLITDGDSSNYIFYTSGSTGEGKAIEGKNSGLSHFIHWELKEFGIDDSFRISQLTRLTFDASLRDIFAALISGGTLCIPSDDIRNDPFRLLTWLEKSKINLIHCVPSLFRVLIKELKLDDKSRVDLRSLRYILMAGELLYVKDVQNWRRAGVGHAELINLYGATETTLIKAFYRIGEV
jgi:non-ribosomal peptide synthetase component F